MADKFDTLQTLCTLTFERTKKSSKIQKVGPLIYTKLNVRSWKPADIELLKLKLLIKCEQVGECWIFRGATNRKGYGTIGFNGASDPKTFLAHRAAYAAFRGEIPSGLLVCHHCDMPACLNPEHLFVGTALGNAIDRDTKGRRGAPRGSRNGNAKLNERQALQIMRSNDRGVALAERFGVDPSLICSIRNRRSWKHVQP